MKVAAVQLNSSTSRDENISASIELIRAAAGEGARLVVTPEMTPVMNKRTKELMADIHEVPLDPAVRAFSALAKELEIWLLIGSVACKSDEESRAANRSVLLTPDGAIGAAYDKIHMFDVSVTPEDTWMESRVYKPGDEIVAVDIDGATLGLTICYDLRFAELYRELAQMGAQIITVPSAFTRPTGEAHWETLLKARAIETGAFVVAAAQGGEHEDGRKTWGHSMIIGPWGAVLAEKADDQPGYIIADLDLSHVDAVRAKIPAWSVPVAGSGA